MAKPWPSLCMECGEVLTAEEIRYYGKTCNACEQARSDRLCAWMKGADDADLDEAFAVPPRVVH